jgi:hypothetical protein
MDERQVTMDDILHVLMWGDVVKLEQDIEHHNWKCTVRGTDIDGDELFFVAAIDEDEHSVLCITVY